MKLKCFLVGALSWGIALPMLAKTQKPSKKTKIGDDVSKKGVDNYKEIVATYNFVGDFSQKEETREVSDEIFWKYPLKPPAIDFEIEYPMPPQKAEFPTTLGQGKPYDHLNRGRIYFLNEDYENAKLTWLGGKKRFGNGYDHHRRNDYFIGSAFLNLSKIALANAPDGYQNQLVKSLFDASSAFLSFAFIVKELDSTQKRDDLIAQVMPKGLYNLAAVYWKYGRFAGAYGAAESGLNYLRKTGRTEYRNQYLRMVAESHIKNRSYLEAIQNLDQSIRQDLVPELAAASFSRAGDIYFDLNNYELAEDVYNLAAIIDNELELVNAAQLILRGEALFWLGKFSESQKVLHYALESPASRKNKAELPKEMAAWGALRFADGYLARQEFDKARLEYYKVRSDFRNHLAGRIALVRESCLNLPYYTGKNISHARMDIEEAKKDPELPPVLVELGWACQVGSYTTRERTPEMLERVKKFSESYPESKFLNSFVIPLKSYQASRLEKYFLDGDFYSATEFYEKNKALLFRHVDGAIGLKLFRAYALTGRSPQAMSFWRFLPRSIADDEDLLLRITVLAEAIDSEKIAVKHKKTWKSNLENLIREAANQNWMASPTQTAFALIDQIKQTKSGIEHSLWILRLYEKWSEKNPNLKCDRIFPLLSQSYEFLKIGKNTGITLEDINKSLDALVKSQMPELFKNDESCAISLVDLETKLNAAHLEVTYKKILNRVDWPMVAGYLNWIWTMSEILYNKGMKSEAQNLWRQIIARAPEDSIEVRFAKQRLDPNKTEFEQLWQ